MNADTIVTLGLEDRDRLNAELGGGLPPGSIALIEGEYSAGKSVLAQRLSYGFCETGRTVTYLSTELSVREFIDQMESLGYGVVDHLLEERLLFLAAGLDGGSELGEVRGPRERKPLLERLMGAGAMWTADIVVLDMFCGILRNDPKFEALVRQNDERQAALEIISFFRDVVSDGRNIVLTVDPTTLDDEVIGPFRSIADVHIEVQMIQVGNETRRQLAVKRFAGMGEQVGEIIGFSVRDDTGIVIESRSVA